MTDKETIAVYDARISDYSKLVTRGKPDRHLRGFLEDIEPKSHILDLGCGPGNSAAMMQDTGHKVDAVDASTEMVNVANEKYGVVARQATFDDIREIDCYNGIWANFSLLHATKANFQRHLATLFKAMKPSGVLHLGMKLGEGEKRDSIGRHYAYYSEIELKGTLDAAGFSTHYTDKGEALGLAGDREPFIILRARKHG